MAHERAAYDTLVSGGQAVLPGRGVVRADIGIRDGRIAAVAERLPRESAGEVIDAAGLHVLPGTIDPHLHFRYRAVDDDFLTETRFAARGGVTTVIGMLREPESYDEIFAAVQRTAEDRAFIDFGFHAVLMTEQHLAALPIYERELGISSFKFYVSYRAQEPIPHGLGPLDDGYMLEAFQRIAALPNSMIIVHAEDTEITSRYINKARAAGQDGVAAWFAARPVVAELEGVRRTLLFAETTGCRVTFLHLTSGAALQDIVNYRSRYSNLLVETCIPYLTHNRVTGTPLGNLFKVKPPLREQADNDALWKGLARGDISWVGSDNVPRKSDEKQGSIWDAAPGVPGTGLILPVILSEGVNKGRFSLERAVEVTSANSARAYNLLPRKGMIAVGADADLAIVDMNLELEVHASDLGGNADYSIYEGWRLKGWPLHTISRGTSVMRDRQIVGSPGHGRYLPRRDSVR
jgi:dihydropyrimidinase